jgi:hypothetical protein
LEVGLELLLETNGSEMELKGITIIGGIIGIVGREVVHVVFA